MRQAIQVKYLGPTNTRGARMAARAAAGRHVVDWDYELDPGENAQRAAEEYAARLNWKGKLIGGSLADGTWCFVFKEKI